MTIKEAEERTGLTRSNIRFYEKEGLIEPSRNAQNGYRDYSEKDVESIKKIAYLRTLEISIEDIRKILSGQVSLRGVIEKQTETIRTQIVGLNKARTMCEKMLEEGNVSFDTLQVEKYVADLGIYWDENKPVFKVDAVGFLHLWSSRLVWAFLTGLCLLAGILSYTRLPSELPVQWSDGVAVSFVEKQYIFIYSLICIAIRVLLRPVIYERLLANCWYGDLIAEYLSNYLCLVTLSVELFSILFVYGWAKNIVAVMLVDTAALIGILIIGIVNINLKYGPASQK